MTETPWEPPIAGTETEHLVGALDRMRWTFRYKADGLDADGLSRRLPPSTLTLGGLLKHLALVEDYQIAGKFYGEPLPAPWDSAPWDDNADWDFASAADDKPADLYALYDAAVARGRARLTAALAEGGLDQPCPRPWPDGRTPTLRRFVYDLLEEYARHTGHADLLREAIDGRTGEDPPDGWRPSA
ncbi:mini-circle protein [Paractinoplanes deccanensis]|uniref:Mini-circle protein n=1 Tax=Paractinoplanes deccanensis TaxID=113561 RepID=A0ABQ3YLZ9_9ACTN|nr:DinB family protein [Actinoplanes deccanensis]GID80977.1 mini-circle protein [Actinoplanes deccanensis]